MSASKIIKQVLIEKGMTLKTLAENLPTKDKETGKAKTGILPTSMRNKLYRDNFTFDEFCTIMDLLGADVKVVMRDSGKMF